MRLIVNGKPREHNGAGTLTALLVEMGADPAHVATMVNDRIIARKDRDGLALREGDTIEVLTFAGGG
jgi:sulfur carrier protein